MGSSSMKKLVAYPNPLGTSLRCCPLVNLETMAQN